MIAHKLRTIFIHIPKTAGSSVEVALDSVEKTNSGAVDPATGKRHPVTTKPEKHYDAVGCKRNYGNDAWCDYFKFSIVRNPWDRIHSAWWNSSRLSKSSREFSEFIHFNLRPQWYRRAAGLMLRRYALPQQLRPQVDWLTSADGRFELDFVCRFENIKDDFAVVSDRIGLEIDELPRILHENRRPESRKHYVEDFDDETSRIVADVYHKDIEQFVYTFGV